ncbi:unnamed protein product [Hyaloperonospora brassicae]|uniref:Uncharacterized protein n=1 Tax=Hyaloperonospora brassicae TaxID=162125 RepID=A0AAV0UVK2_HYABA|nr:unnamed protein product [Hyaloperonospora brassicae]
MTSKATRPSALVAAVLLALCCWSMADVSYTYPKCPANGVGCCKFGMSSMKSRGMVTIALEGSDMVVTCSNGFLRCSNENPEKKASFEIAPNVTCPDFTAMMESRSAEITYLSGVRVKTNGEPVAGVVQAANI